MLVGDTQVFLFISLLILHDEVVEEYLVELVEILLK